MINLLICSLIHYRVSELHLMSYITYAWIYLYYHVRNQIMYFVSIDLLTSFEGGYTL